MAVKCGNHLVLRRTAQNTDKKLLTGLNTGKTSYKGCLPHNTRQILLQ